MISIFCLMPQLMTYIGLGGSFFSMMTLGVLLALGLLVFIVVWVTGTGAAALGRWVRCMSCHGLSCIYHLFLVC